MAYPAAPGVASHFSSLLIDIKTITRAVVCGCVINNWLYVNVSMSCPVLSNLGFEIISVSSSLTCSMSLSAGACRDNWFVTFMPFSVVIQLVYVQLWLQNSGLQNVLSPALARLRYVCNTQVWSRRHNMPLIRLFAIFISLTIVVCTILLWFRLNERLND
jgi:hypothetical protein